ncbi:MAG: class I SAM-dependent methyltransferase [Thermoanaerobaculia bacterium]|nr:class I SAM-dependent methyltransferase [Thermoanaerobaculia bacterium]
MSRHFCRFCEAPLIDTFVDLGMSPPANSYLEESALDGGETFFPLHTYVCRKCFLVQLPEWQTPDAIFSDYAYFSSYSDSWLAHAKNYTEQMRERFSIDEGHLVVEVASNDGYLLQYFVERGIPVLGIEPAANVAEAAEKVGVPTEVAFFGTELARRLVAEGQRADLLLGNNVLAHTPLLNDFVAGLKILLAETGLVTLEFPHLQRLIELNQFDTIYHEHFSYFSFRTVKSVLEHHGLTVFDVEELPTHGGSLRVFARHVEDRSKPVSEAVGNLVSREERLGFHTLEPYRTFGEKVRGTKRQLLRTLIDLKAEGKTVAGYGAPAKGVTFLNYCGVRTDLLDFTVDRSPHKQGRYLPGVHIPIHAPDRIRETRPDVVWILPWNLRREISEQMADIRDWGGRFLVTVPDVELF